MSPPVTIRQVLVGLDGSDQSRVALETAAQLAAALRAELLGLFVEDAELLAAARLPLAGQVAAEGVQPVTAADIERHMRLQAQRVEGELAAAARGAGVHGSFQQRRGEVTKEVFAAAVDADLVVVGRGGWAAPGRLGTTALRLVTEGATPALLPGRGPVPAGAAVAVLCDPAFEQDRTLATAATLAAATGRRLLLLSAAHETLMDAARLRVARQLAPGTRVTLTELVSSRPESILDAVQAAAMLLLPGDSALLSTQNLEALLARAELPVMVVR